MEVSKSEYIKELEEKKKNSKNSHEKRIYSKRIQEEKNNICSHCHREYGIVEHCSEPDCPECNIVAYNNGYEDGKDYWKKQMEEDKKKFI